MMRLMSQSIEVIPKMKVDVFRDKMINPVLNQRTKVEISSIHWPASGTKLKKFFMAR